MEFEVERFWEEGFRWLFWGGGKRNERARIWKGFFLCGVLLLGFISKSHPTFSFLFLALKVGRLEEYFVSVMLRKIGREKGKI